MKLELRVKKWKEKDLGRSAVSWMFKGWDTLGIGWNPLWGQMGDPHVRLHGCEHPVTLSCIRLPFLLLEDNQNNSSFAWKGGKGSHDRLTSSFSPLLFLLVPVYPLCLRVHN